MSLIIQTEATADARGGIHLDLPDDTVQPNSKLILKVEIDQKSNPNGRFSKRFATRKDYEEALDRIFAKSSDPTFVPPDDQALQDIEPL